MTDESQLYQLAEKLGSILLKRKIRCVVAESCTGGSLAALMTEIAGASAWFERGFVTYSNLAKQQLLSVPNQLLSSQGAVSEAVACKMAEGALLNSDSEVSVAITGIAGPQGGSEDKPVGTVWIAWAGDLIRTESHCYHFKGDRSSIRRQAVAKALQGLIKRCHPDTHPKLQYPGHERYFFAIWPNDKTAKAINQLNHQLLKKQECLPVKQEKLHLTLAYLGKVYPEFLNVAKKAVDQLKCNPFSLQINSINHWSRAKVSWLGIQSPPQELMQLQTAIVQQMLPLGLKPETKRFIPHITIARRCKQKIPKQPVETISWPVDEFCLVKSSSITGGSEYEIIARWPL